MATLGMYKKATDPKPRVVRYFSEDFKRKKVREIEENLVSVCQVGREYSVSRAAIYNWIYKYSSMRKKGVRQVVESQSDTVKISRLKEQIREMERLVGQKQIAIDFLEKMIELAEQEYGVEIKKKFSSRRSGGSGVTGDRTE